MKRFVVLVAAAMLAGTLLAQTDGVASPEELLRQVFTALEQKDSAALQKLAIGQDEFKKFVWPSIGPAASGTTPEKFYKMYSASSAVGVDEWLERYGGRKVEVLKVSLDAPRKQAKNYRLLPGAEVKLRDDGGQERTVRMLGGVLERDGHYKVATYYVRPGAETPAK